jgi:flagellar biosynthetic protein FliR
MQAEWLVHPETAPGFLLILGRVAGVFTFVPIPGVKTGLDAPRILLSLAVAVGLSGHWPQIQTDQLTAARMALLLFQEVLLGTGIGLLVSFLTDAFLLAFQIPALQAGYTYASTIDPATSADSSVLQIFSQLMCGLLFFSFGLHREVLRAVVASLEGHPPGRVLIGPEALTLVLELGRMMFTTALRLALPVVAMLLMVDFTLALMSRLNTQLQLIMLMFPVKMLLSLVIFSWLVAAVPVLYQTGMSHVLAALRRLISP